MRQTTSPLPGSTATMPEVVRRLIMTSPVLVMPTPLIIGQ